MSAWTNGSKMRAASSAAIPMPVSRTANARRSALLLASGVAVTVSATWARRQ
ncbi:hypothetical protein LP420_35660 [Massilia sp. B-10]|nr:hypothetical protein LP420_35660 [Massilia sp. B-10]